MKDHYKTLGVTKSASDSEIKSAFRKLAKKHHPDAGGDETKFQAINEAYETLKDPNKRAEYDNPQPQNPFTYSRGFGGNRYHDTININDIFAEAFMHQPRRAAARGKDITIIINLMLKDVLIGKKIIASYSLATGETESVEVEIPAGVQDGMKIKYSGMGDIAHPQLPRGDLYVKVNITYEKGWDRSGDDLITEIRVNALDMMLGSSVLITMLDDRKVKLQIPAGAQNNSVYGIAEHGIPNINSNRRGRLLIRVIAEIPSIKSDDAIEKLKEVQRIIHDKS